MTIECALLLSPQRVLFQAGSCMMSLDLASGSLGQVASIEDFYMISGVASPSGDRLALGDETTMLIGQDEIVEVHSTLNAMPIGWVGEKALILRSPYGGVLHVDIAEYTKVAADKRQVPGGLARGVSALLFHEGLHEGEEVDEHRMCDTRRAHFFRDKQGAHVIELIDGDLLNLYDVSETELTHRWHCILKGTHMIRSDLFMCGEKLVQLEAGIAKIMNRQGEVLVEHEVPAGANPFSDLEQERLFLVRGKQIFRFDPGDGSEHLVATCATVPRQCSSSGAALLVATKESLEILDVDDGSSRGTLVRQKKSADWCWVPNRLR